MKVFTLLAFFAISLTGLAQDAFDYGYNGTFEAGEITISDDVECLDVKNGTMASFKVILMINGGASVKQFTGVGKCLSDDLRAALKDAPAGTEVMFTSVKQVGEAGSRIDVPGKTFKLKK